MLPASVRLAIETRLENLATMATTFSETPEGVYRTTVEDVEVAYTIDNITGILFVKAIVDRSAGATNPSQGEGAGA